MGNIDKTVSKTIRLPLDLVAYIELQDGENFSQQLQGILNDYRSGDADRKKKLAEYRRSINRYKEVYSRLVDDYAEAFDIMQGAQWYLRRLKTLADNPLPETETAAGSPPAI